MINHANGTKKYLVAIDTKDVEHAIVAPENHLSLTRIVEGVIAISPEDAAGCCGFLEEQTRVRIKRRTDR